MRKHTLLIAVAAVCAAVGCNRTIVDPEYDWSPAGDNIRTRWADQVSPAMVHPEYPRPQMVRSEWQSLNGLWEYAIGPAEEVDLYRGAEAFPGADGCILVPFCVESSLSGVGKTITADDALWYHTTFTIPRSWKKKYVLLNFGAVDWHADVYLNGSYQGSHTGGYTSFTIDITPYLKDKGEQDLVIRVTDATDNEFQPRGKQVSRPGGIWYTAVSGIWQSVWLEPVSAEEFLTDYNVLSDIGQGTVSVTPFTSAVHQDMEMVVSLMEGGVGYDPEHPSTKVLAEQRLTPDMAGMKWPAAELQVPDLQLWSPDHPYIYGLRFTAIMDGKVIDEVNSYTTVREVSVVEDTEGHKRIGLNGKPIFNYGPLDQGWWPDGLYTAPTDEALAYDVEMTREYGFNMIRKHIKVEPARWYYHCDRLGVMVWQDMPSFSSSKNEWAQGVDVYDAGTDYPVTAAIRENFYKEWGEIIAQLKKNQCIVMWVPFNEAWGQFDTRDVVAFTSAADPSRLINHASGGNWVSGGVGDVLDSHHYPWPYMRIWDPQLVNVLGEYGGIGRPVDGHLWQKDRNWGYVQYGTEEEATDEYVHFTEMLKPYVLEGCSAAVYTQTTDVEGEVNGLMTYDREINKLTVDRVSAANRSVIDMLSEQF